MNALEATATLLGVANILLLVRRSIWNFPFGLAMVALYCRIFFDARLYSDALLQIFFFVIQIYGWWAWWRVGADRGFIEVARMTMPARMVWIAAMALISVAWGAIMDRYTDAAYPWWDGSVAVVSIAAQIQLARRLIENWVLWIIVDVVAIGLYFKRGLELTAGLYVLFLALAVYGLFEWLRAERRQTAGPTAGSTAGSAAGSQA